MAAAVSRSADWLSPDQVRELSVSLHEPEALRGKRLEAYDRFLELPLEPDPLYRGYGYFTNVDLTGLDALTSGAAIRAPEPHPGSVRVVHDASGTHVDVPEGLRDAGVSVTAIGSPEGGRLWEPRSGFLDREEPPDRLSALSVALLNRGYLLEIPDRVRAPVHVQDLTVLSRGHEALSVRRAFRAGEGTQLLVTEEVYSDPAKPGGQRLYASSTDVGLSANAKALCLTLHAPDTQAVSIYRRSATTGPSSRLGWLWVGLGGFRTKARNRTRLVGNGSVVDDLQMFYGAGEQSYDSSVYLTHEGTDTHGQSITRGVFTDKARGMSRGLVRIAKDAAKTLSFISEHAMLLSRGARSDTIPILEILCRDVKATHSTSVHPVDPEQVFYLKSRGITENDAIRMIGEGFLSYVLDRAPIASLRDIVYPSLEARWNGKELFWNPDRAGGLPDLQVTGTEASPEWRFDAKLR